MFDRDRLVNINRDDAAKASFKVVDNLQQLPKEHRVAGTCIAFLLMCEHLGVEPQDAFTISNNVMHDRNNGFGLAKQFTAAREYLANER